jgi:OHCU decarboxylase
MSLLPLGELNAVGQAEFAQALTPLFEAAAPLANALYLERPFASYDALIDRAEAIAAALPDAARVAVVNAHPRIGASPRLLSAASYREQGYAAESAFAATELDATLRSLAELNAQYEDRFGFRFVVWVNKRPKAAIVEVLRARLGNSRDVELATGLQEMFSIARDRLAALAERPASPLGRGRARRTARG